MFNRLLNRNRNNTNEAQASDNVPEEDNENNIPSVNEWQIEKQFYLKKIAELEVRLKKIEKSKTRDVNRPCTSTQAEHDGHTDLIRWTNTENLTHGQHHPRTDDDFNQSDVRSNYEAGNLEDMSDWSLTNPDLRNYQDYDNNLECFDDWLDGETINGRQSPVRSVRREATPDQNNRGNAPVQNHQDQRQQQVRSTSRV